MYITCNNSQQNAARGKQTKKKTKSKQLTPLTSAGGFDVEMEMVSVSVSVINQPPLTVKCLVRTQNLNR